MSVAAALPSYSGNYFSIPQDPPIFQPHAWLADRYELVKILGSGGCAQVYLAIDHQAEDPLLSHVAIKMLRSELLPSTYITRAFRAEFDKTQTLSKHPSRPNLFSFHQEEHRIFFVMEALEGKTLGQLLRYYAAAGAPRDSALVLVQQILSSLQVLHQEGWVHCDIKPGNLFFSKPDAQVKILDFAMACKIGDETQISLPREGLTPAYASLETIRGEPADIRDDIYSVACVIYELLTGQHPFNRWSAEQAFKANLQAKPIEDLTRQQWQLLNQALAFERDERLADIGPLLKSFSPGIAYQYSWRLFLGSFLLSEAFFQCWALWKG